MKNLLQKIKQTGIRHKDNKAFVLFVALVVAGIMLSVGFSISNLVVKELILSTTGRESQIAFYAADTGAECALYWDRKDSYGQAAPFGVFAPETINLGGVRIVCGQGKNNDGEIHSYHAQCDVSGCGLGTKYATTTFIIDLHDQINPNYKACAKVTVVKNFNTVPETTTIDSRGYNVPFIEDTTIVTGGSAIVGGQSSVNGRCDTSDPRSVERGLFLQY